jgi:uncharacterized protein YecE (DUF72 family)
VRPVSTGGKRKLNSLSKRNKGWSQDPAAYEALLPHLSGWRHALEPFFVGTAGWSIPKEYAGAFPGDGSHLERYARIFRAVEINSSFYRPHRPSTYERWAASVPTGFQFSVKLPREITHTRRLVDAVEPLDRFLGEVRALGSALGPLLVQLPPSLRFEQATAEQFLDDFREKFDGQLACEPRHETWFGNVADAVLRNYHVARVAADPAVVPQASHPGGWPGLVYIRLHGSPKVYYSAYSPEAVAATARRLHAAPSEAGNRWCIFDNTAVGEATGQALDLFRQLQ